jgi:hypothetical protein
MTQGISGIGSRFNSYDFMYASDARFRHEQNVQPKYGGPDASVGDSGSGDSGDAGVGPAPEPFIGDTGGCADAVKAGGAAIGAMLSGAVEDEAPALGQVLEQLSEKGAEDMADTICNASLFGELPADAGVDGTVAQGTAAGADSLPDAAGADPSTGVAPSTSEDPVTTSLNEETAAADSGNQTASTGTSEIAGNVVSSTTGTGVEPGEANGSTTGPSDPGAPSDPTEGGSGGVSGPGGSGGGEMVDPTGDGGGASNDAPAARPTPGGVGMGPILGPNLMAPGMLSGVAGIGLAQLDATALVGSATIMVRG